MTGCRAAGLLVCVALLGCSAEPAPQPAPTASPSSPGKILDPGLVPTPVASDPAAVGPAAGRQRAGTPVPGTAPGPSAPFTGNTQAAVREPTGGPFGVRAARVSRHAGYDRVVVELAGPASGAPGWRVGYVAAPTSDGSGNPIAMKGKYFLQVGVQGVGYPADTGVPEPSVRRFTPADTTVVQEYVLDTVFEGVYTTYVGLTDRVAYRVSALRNPTRIVIDLRHP